MLRRLRSERLGHSRQGVDWEPGRPIGGTSGFGLPGLPCRDHWQVQLKTFCLLIDRDLNMLTMQNIYLNYWNIRIRQSSI